MVYKKFVNHKGKKLGPYYYKSVRGKDGKIKSVYLGNSLEEVIKNLPVGEKLKGSVFTEIPKKELDALVKKVHGEQSFTSINEKVTQYNQTKWEKKPTPVSIIKTAKKTKVLTPSEKSKSNLVPKLVALSFIALFLFALPFITPFGQTGFVIIDVGDDFITYQESFDLIVDSTAEQAIEIESPPESFYLETVTVSGVIRGPGSVSAYLETELGNRILIFSDDQIRPDLTESTAGVTGFVTAAGGDSGSSSAGGDSSSAGASGGSSADGESSSAGAPGSSSGGTPGGPSGGPPSSDPASDTSSGDTTSSDPTTGDSQETTPTDSTSPPEESTETPSEETPSEETPTEETPTEETPTEETPTDETPTEEPADTTPPTEEQPADTTQEPSSENQTSQPAEETTPESDVQNETIIEEIINDTTQTEPDSNETETAEENQTTNETSELVNQTTLLNETGNQTLINETFINETNQTNQTIDLLDIIQFSNICFATCNLTSLGLSDTSYTLVFEVEDGTTLDVSNALFTIKNTTEEINQTNETNQTLTAPIIEFVSFKPSTIVVENTSLEIHVNVTSNVSISKVLLSIDDKPNSTLTNATNTSIYVFEDIDTSMQAFYLWEITAIDINGLAAKPKDGTFRVIPPPPDNVSINLTIRDSKEKIVIADIDIFEEDEKNKSNRKLVKALKSKEKDEVTPPQGGGGLFGAAVVQEPVEIPPETIEAGSYDIEVVPPGHVIKKIEFRNVQIQENITATIGIDDVNETEEFERFEEVYAIDPTNLNFTNATVTVTAQGTSLYKCAQWNFTTQTCFGEWVFLQSITPGQEYTFTLTPDDPGFAEQITNCAAENEATQGNFSDVCDNVSGYNLQFDDGLVETHDTSKTGQSITYAGLRIESVNSSVTDCSIIDSVSICYEYWVSGTTEQVGDCDISVDADGNASYTPISTSCPGIILNPGVSCLDVTANESWTCDNFFGTNGTRAQAKIEFSKIGGSGIQTGTWDVFYFNVSYNSLVALNGSINITIFGPVNNTTLSPQNCPAEYCDGEYDDDDNDSDADLDITFKYSVNSTYNLSYCTIVVDNESNITAFSPNTNQNQSLEYKEFENGESLWYVLCEDVNGYTQTSEINILIIDEQHELNASVTDATGEDIDVEIELLEKLKNGTHSKKYNSSGKSHNFMVSEDIYDIIISPNNHSIRSIRIHDVEFNDNLTQIIDIDDVPETGELAQYAEVYAINPRMNFTNATVTVTATGSTLYKCKDWNYTNRSCYGTWELFKTDLVPGQNYTFILTPDDPGFAEEVSSCAAEDLAAKGSFAGACDNTTGFLLEFDDGLVETHLHDKGSLYAGVEIQSVNTSVTDCGTIDEVFFCYEHWSTAGTRAPLDCDVSVDANAGASYTIIDAVCPGTTANPGVTCTNVTATEAWTCANFFGSSGTRAQAKSEMTRITSGPTASETASWDVFFFNVSYSLQETVPPGAITNLIGNSFSSGTILWNWTNPVDADFNKSIVFIDGTNIANTTNEFFEGTGFQSSSTHTITVHTIDNAGNVNSTDVNNTTTTLAITDGNSGTFLINDSGDEVRFSFRNGTLVTTRFNDVIDAVELNDTTTGTFISDVLDPNGNSTWRNISWRTNAYGELPINQTIETKFATGNADMTGNVLLYRLNEDTANTAPGGADAEDFSGQANHATETGTVTFGADGQLNRSYFFDGVDDFLTMTAKPPTGTGSVTVEAWINASDLSGNEITWGAGIARSTNADAIGDWMLSVDDGGSVHFTLWENAGADTDGVAFTADGVITTNTWYHVVGKFNGTGKSIYVNGQEFSTSPETTATGWLVGNEIGRIFDTPATYYFTGSIDEVAVYNRSLSASEIQDHYERGLVRFNLAVQSCDDAACSGEIFTDIDDTFPQLLPVGNNTHFQYKFDMETDNITVSPELYNVSIQFEIAEAAVPDTTPPSVVLNAPANGTVQSSATITFNITATDAGDGIQNVSLFIDGQLNTTNTSGFGGDYLFSFSGLTDGVHNWSIEANDAAGNQNQSETRYFTIDLPPIVTFFDFVGVINDSFNTTSLNESTLPDINKFRVLFNISDSFGINSIRLFFRNTNGSSQDTCNSFNSSIVRSIQHNIWISCIKHICTNSSIGISNCIIRGRI